MSKYNLKINGNRVGLRASRHKKTNRRRKAIKKCIIKRICRMPPSSVFSDVAEVMYRNSNFGLAVEPCERSRCNMCLLGKRRRCRKQNKHPKGRARQKQASNKRVLRRKRRTLLTDRELAVERAIQHFERSNNMLMYTNHTGLPMCICTEVNGNLYKIMNIPAGVKNVSPHRRSPVNRRRRRH